MCSDSDISALLNISGILHWKQDHRRNITGSTWAGGLSRGRIYHCKNRKDTFLRVSVRVIISVRGYGLFRSGLV